jgi:chromosome partitioning protein
MPILLFSNLKGGVAKTTNAVAVAECLASAGHRTLLIDADHQCMASELLIGEERLWQREHKHKTFHDLLTSFLDPDFSPERFGDYVVENASDIGGGMERLSLLPCSIRIDDFATNVAKARRGFQTTQEYMSASRTRRDAMRRWLRANFDYTIVDCPPSIPVQVRWLMMIGDAFIVPCVPDRLSVRGSEWLLDRLRRANIKIHALGTLWSLYRAQNSIHREVVEGAAAGEDRFAKLPRPFDTVIPNASAIAKAAEPGQSYASFSTKYAGGFHKHFQAACEEIALRCTTELEDA